MQLRRDATVTAASCAMTHLHGECAQHDFEGGLGRADALARIRRIAGAWRLRAPAKRPGGTP